MIPQAYIDSVDSDKKSQSSHTYNSLAYNQYSVIIV
jgi:hypothetical protein